MIASISPSVINGSITAPASKSAMQRACALALMINGETVIRNPGKSDDDKVAISIISALGAHVIYSGSDLMVNSTGIIKPVSAINCGDSGLSFRMFAAIAALSENEIEITGTGSLMKRNMDLLEQIFPKVAVQIKTSNGYLPVSIKGPLIPASMEIDGSQSSQYLTGLLFAFAKSATRPVTIHVSNLKSKPYIDLSLQMLKYFGYDVSHDNYTRFQIIPVDNSPKTISYTTEADWSSASFLLVAGAIAGSVSIKGLLQDSIQADKTILEALKLANAQVHITAESISVNNENKLKPFFFDATHCPDLFPPLVVLAGNCPGLSVIKGVSRLAGKESDRSLSLIDVFEKMGIQIYLKDDEMFVTGGTGLHAATVSSHHDHRIAMACAIAGLTANGTVVIENAEAINKSYPDFYQDLTALSVSIKLIEQ